MTWKYTHTPIYVRSHTDNAYQSKYQATRRKKLPAEIRGRSQSTDLGKATNNSAALKAPTRYGGSVWRNIQKNKHNCSTLLCGRVARQKTFLSETQVNAT